MSAIKPIRNAADYQQAMARIESIFEAAPGSAEFDELDVLTTLIQAYDAVHHPIPEPDPIEYIKYKMQERGLRQRDLAEWLGGESRVSEILNRRRKLTAKMMKALHDNLGISAEVLLAAA
ncbi:helix-turn-helix domain-containing protein [Hymenobacter lutimineralis]|uniref:Helix-turn-helix domain-containing protein n=1 Tax=Hymenobacter lutimineralis TaxID=2606448 RepID=A0A5D6UR17_9BACT|nr:MULTISPECIES: helix-turn-helix domain-containing protein [Hymenobacter]QIX59881.1 helix-turn-helix domain-containing protein [Hymenobacter sp. BT18]TYZ05883.1 helix-turn-helix domain-containing protein [Hymenobacter lutimineralis]